MASIDARLRLLAPGKVSEDDKLVDFDALLLDRFFKPCMERIWRKRIYCLIRTDGPEFVEKVDRVSDRTIISHYNTVWTVNPDRIGILRFESDRWIRNYIKCGMWTGSRFLWSSSGPTRNFQDSGSLVNVRTENINPITLNVIHSMGKDISLYLFCVSEKDKFAVADLQNAIMYEFDIEPNHEGTLLFWWLRSFLVRVPIRAASLAFSRPQSDSVRKN
ncbi:hypothetical protein QQ045_009834 [Rhodiola kirilowii]